MKKLYSITILAIISLIFISQTFGLALGQAVSYSGTIASINYSEKSFATTGTKTATVTATYGSQSATNSCSVNITAPSGATCAFSKSVYYKGEKIEARVCGTPWTAVSWVTSLNNQIKCIDQQNTDAAGCVTFGTCLNAVSEGRYGFDTFYNYGSVYDKPFNCSFELREGVISTTQENISQQLANLYQIVQQLFQVVQGLAR